MAPLKIVKNRKFHLVKAISIIVCLESCTSLVNPYISPSNQVTNSYNDTPSLENAINYSNNLRAEYLGALSDQAYLNAGVGLTLIGVSAAAFALGATGGATNAIIGLGIGGTAAYLANTFLYSKPRQLIYAAGAGAISCSVSATEPLRVASRLINKKQIDSNNQELNSFTQNLANLNLNLNKLKALIKKHGNSLPVVAAENIFLEGEVSLKKGRQAEVIISTAGGTLYSAVEQIRTKVNRALIDTEPNIQTLVESLSSTIPLRAGQIAPIPKGTFDEGDPVHADVSGLEEIKKELNELMRSVVSNSEQVLFIVRLVEKGPTSEAMQGCQVNIEKSGLNFSVSETSLNMKKMQTANIIISGGQPPYGINWTGNIPASTALQANLNYQNDGTGVVIIKALSAVDNNNYSLLIQDKSVNKVIVEITTQGKSENSKTAPLGSGPSSIVVDPKIYQIQSFLNVKKDGFLGPDTISATKSFLEKVPPAEDVAVNFILKSKKDMLIEWLRSETPPEDWVKQALKPAVEVPTVEQKQMKKLYDLLKERGCINGSPDIENNIKKVEDAIDSGISKIKEIHPEPPRLNTIVWLKALENDANKELKCK